MPQQPDAPDEHEDVPPEGTEQRDGVSPPDDAEKPDSVSPPDTSAAAEPPTAASTPPSAPAQPDWPPPDAPTAPAGSGARAASPAGGRGPGVGTGVGLGCVAHVIAFPVMFATLMSAAGIWGALWPFYVIGVAAIVGMFFVATRKVSTGVLIVSAAAWIVFLGPCVALVGGI